VRLDSIVEITCVKNDKKKKREKKTRGKLAGEKNRRIKISQCHENVFPPLITKGKQKNPQRRGKSDFHAGGGEKARKEGRVVTFYGGKVWRTTRNDVQTITIEGECPDYAWRKSVQKKRERKGAQFP